MPTIGEGGLIPPDLWTVPASGAIADDAEELAKYQGLLKGTNAFNNFVEKAIAQVHGKKRPPIEAAKIGRKKE